MGNSGVTDAKLLRRIPAGDEETKTLVMGCPQRCSDDEAVRVCRRDPRRAVVESLFEQAQSVVESFVRLHCSHSLLLHTGIQDVAQEVYLNAWKNIGSFRGDSLHEFLPWIKEVARHTILNIAHSDCRLKREPQHYWEFCNLEDRVAQVPDPRSKDPTDLAVEHEQTECLRRIAKSTLTRESALILEAVYWHGLSVKRIASLVGVSRGAVCKRLRRLRRLLQRQVQRENEEGERL